MSTWAVIGIIAIVLGVIVSNIMLLKYSAKFKMPKTYTPPSASRSEAEPEVEVKPEAENDDENSPRSTTAAKTNVEHGSDAKPDKR
ncbi:DUF2897 family protein [Alteromonas gilva]|uniref:DUF2897 family protein n=1 Tax=Alteromonas gilva TaxID=2987522 RepID=A0ABT5L382_9ALTE|nr:DUF2897 family protein [Alteromonas gilva]MDC8831494.1 DUF2897 family protein [Alteromonas gilva]